MTQDIYFKRTYKISESQYFSVPDSGPFEIYEDSNEFRWYVDLCCELRTYKIHADYLVFQKFDELQAHELYLCIRDKKILEVMK